MSEDRTLSADDRHRTSFIALVLLLREMARSLLSEGRSAEARGLIDSLDALKAKTKGNLDTEEQAFVDDVLLGLHLEAVKRPAKEPEGGSSKGAEDAGPKEPEAGSASSAKEPK